MTPIPVTANNDYTPNIVTGRNVNDVHHQGLSIIYHRGVVQETRNGPAKVLPGPLISHYKHPQFRVLFDPRRDANPFFHLFESLWMITGSNVLESVAQFVPTMANYSDDGKSLNGAYGYRWRRAFSEWGSDSDQIQAIVKELRSNPSSRRCVLQMWDTRRDLMNQKSKDLCCNLLVKYRILDNKLHAYVMNRSNDMVFGGYGANVFHFSFLQEYLADLIGVGVGCYEQISLDAHIYTQQLYGEKLWDGVYDMITGVLSDDLYHPVSSNGAPCFSLSPVNLRPHWYSSNGSSVYTYSEVKADLSTEQALSTDDEFVEDCSLLLRQDGHDNPRSIYQRGYFYLVAAPMREAYSLFKKKNHQQAIDLINSASSLLNSYLAERYADDRGLFIPNAAYPNAMKVELDLFVAGRQWIQRRLDAINAKEQP